MKKKIKKVESDKSKTLVSFKMDKKLKKQTDILLQEIGIPVSTMINIWLRKLVVDKGVWLGRPQLPEVNSIEELNNKLIKSMNSGLIKYEDSWFYRKMQNINMAEKKEVFEYAN